MFPQRRRLKRRKVIHFQRRLAGLIRDHTERRRPMTEISATVAGWVNHVRFGNTVGLRQAVLRRAIIRPSRTQHNDVGP